VIELAQSLAVSAGPLVPYPKWRFDADWTNPDLAFCCASGYGSIQRPEARSGHGRSLAPRHTSLPLPGERHKPPDLYRRVYRNPNEFAS